MKVLRWAFTHLCLCVWERETLKKKRHEDSGPFFFILLWFFFQVLSSSCSLHSRPRHADVTPEMDEIELANQHTGGRTQSWWSVPFKIQARRGHIMMKTLLTSFRNDCFTLWGSLNQLPSCCPPLRYYVCRTLNWAACTREAQLICILPAMVDSCHMVHSNHNHNHNRLQRVMKKKKEKNI